MTTAEPVLDHLALASERAWDNVIRYCYHLGGRWMGGPTEHDADTFYFAQVEFTGGTKLELLEPYNNVGSEFLDRFLHRSGPGPHHFTFKVPDLEAMIGRVEAAGYEVVGVKLDNPDWKEAFLHPKSGHGIVIQMAQQGPNAGWEQPPPLPPTTQGPNSVIDKVQYLVADLEQTAALYTDVFAMTEVARGDGPAGPFVTLTSGPWKLVLQRPERGGAKQWLGDRSGRLLSVDMGVDHVAVVPDLRAIPGGYVLQPQVNQGLRVHLRPNDTPPTNRFG